MVDQKKTKDPRKGLRNLQTKVTDTIPKQDSPNPDVVVTEQKTNTPQDQAAQPQSNVQPIGGVIDGEQVGGPTLPQDLKSPAQLKAEAGILPEEETLRDQPAINQIAASVATGGGLATAQGVAAGRGFTAATNTFTNTAIREKSITSLANKFSVNEVKIANEIKRREISSEITKLMTKKSLINSKAVKLVAGGGLLLASGEGIAVWYGVDNIISGTGILARDTAQDVRFGADIEEGRKRFDQMQENVDLATSFVTQATYHNPLLWAIGKFYRQGIKAQQFAIDENRARMEEGAVLSGQ